MSVFDAASLIGLCAAAVLALKIVVDAVSRVAVARQSLRDQALPSIDARLDQLTAAVEAIAIEVERQGELQRFAARLVADARATDGAPAPTRLPIARPITPH